MKKVAIVLSLSFILVIAAIIGIYFSLTEMTRVNVNPFIEEEHWYVQVDEDGITDEEDQGSVYYLLPAVNEQGEEKDIEFLALSELREDAFIQLTLKDEYVTTYEEVDEEDLPEQMRDN